MKALAVLLSLAFVLAAVFAGELVLPGMRHAALLWFSMVVFLWAYGVSGVALAIRAATRSRIAAVAAAIVVSLTGLHLSCGPMYYRGEPLRARVVDFPALTPVPGATVHAQWRLEESTNLHGSADAGAIQRAIVRTGADGTFTIPAWGPVPRPPFAYMGDNDPLLWIAAPGRVGNRETNDSLSGVEPRSQFSSRRSSPWNGRDLWVFPQPR